MGGLKLSQPLAKDPRSDSISCPLLTEGHANLMLETLPRPEQISDLFYEAYFQESAQIDETDRRSINC